MYTVPPQMYAYPAQYPQYGALNGENAVLLQPELSKPKQSTGARDRHPLSRFTYIVGCVFFPWLVFMLVCLARAMRYDWQASQMINIMSWAGCLLILAIAFITCCPQLFKSYDNSGAHSAWWFLLISTLLAWGVGFAYGDSLYAENFKPYYDVTNLNVYPSVDPALYKGSQLMDAGQIEFLPGSHLDLSKSYGFKNENIYCVAPIVGPKQTNASQTMPQYDYWAIGLNCCSGHTPDFHCGEFSNSNAHKGLRLMKDRMRDYYRLAVEEATAAYNIKAPQPIFLYWMESPESEVHAYSEDGWKSMMDGIIVFLIVQVTLVTGAVSCVNWMSAHRLATDLDVM